MLRLLRAGIKLVVTLVALFALLLTFLWLTNPKPADSIGWTRLADMPIAFGESAGAFVGDSLVVVGGLRGLTTVVERGAVYDADADRWQRLRAPLGLHHAAAAVVDERLIVTGGARSVFTWSGSAVASRYVGRRFEQVALMSEGRQGHTSVAIGTRLYVVGGVAPTRRVSIYDSARDRWSHGSPVPVARDHLRAVAWDGKVWIIGGRSGDPVRRVDIYDPKADSWSRGPDLPEPMSAMAVGVLSDGLHVVGGEDPNAITGGVSDAHFVLPKGSDTWRRGPPPILAVHGAAYGVHDDKLYIAGGASRQGALSTISWTPTLQVFAPESR